MLEISLKAEEIFHIGGWPVTNAVFLSTIVLILLAAMGWILRRKLALVPGMICGTAATKLRRSAGSSE